MPASSRRQRRKSTGWLTERGRNPPKEIKSEIGSGRLIMHMRLPVHLWAILCCGREAEAIEAEVACNGDPVKGLGIRRRWREYDEDLHREYDAIVEPFTWTSTRREYVMQRMRWVKRDGLWQGAWTWDFQYPGDIECRNDPLSESSHALQQPSAGPFIPVEILCCVAEQIEVSTLLSSPYSPADSLSFAAPGW